MIEKNYLMTPMTLVYLLIPIVLIGPIAMDMYLPAIPNIRDALQVSAYSVQWTLSAFVLGFGFSQLFVGLLSSIFGINRCLICALAIFSLVSVGCAISNSISYVIAFRFIQAVSSCITMVLSMAIIRRFIDNTNENLRAYSILAASTALAPIFAPIVGAQILSLFGHWQAIFVSLAIASIIGLMIYIFKISPHTEVEKKHCIAKQNYMIVVKTKEFWSYASIGAIGMAIIFSFFSIAPLIFIDIQHLNANQFSILFGCYGIFFLLGNLLGPKWVKIFGEIKSFIYAYGVIATLAAIVFFIPFLHYNIYAFLVSMMLTNFFIGITFGPAMACAMKNFKEEAEQAASVYGFQQFVFAFIIATLLTTFDFIYPKQISIMIFILSIGLLLKLYIDFKETKVC